MRATGIPDRDDALLDLMPAAAGVLAGVDGMAVVEAPAGGVDLNDLDAHVREGGGRSALSQNRGVVMFCMPAWP